MADPDPPSDPDVTTGIVAVADTPLIDLIESLATADRDGSALARCVREVVDEARSGSTETVAAFNSSL